MEKKIYTLEEIKERLSDVFKAHDVKKAYVFGSYSKGCACEDSDVDLYVDSDLHGFRFIELIEDVREALGKDVDVFSTRQIDKGTPIESEICKYGVQIYEK